MVRRGGEWCCFGRVVGGSRSWIEALVVWGGWGGVWQGSIYCIDARHDFFARAFTSVNSRPTAIIHAQGCRRSIFVISFSHDARKREHTTLIVIRLVLL